METLPLTDDRFVSSSDGLSDGLSGSLGSVGLFGLLGSVGVVGVVPPLEPPLLPLLEPPLLPPELLPPSEPADSLSTDTLICVSAFDSFPSIALKSTVPFTVNDCALRLLESYFAVD